MTSSTDQTLRRKRRIQILKHRRLFKANCSQGLAQVKRLISENSDQKIDIPISTDERRLKNRLSAERSRIKRQVESESLLRKVADLESENQSLRLRIVNLEKFPRYLKLASLSPFILSSNQSCLNGFTEPAVF